VLGLGPELEQVGLTERDPGPLRDVLDLLVQRRRIALDQGPVSEGRGGRAFAGDEGRRAAKCRSSASLRWRSTSGRRASPYARPIARGSPANR
jgi:hypothetical protein